MESAAGRIPAGITFQVKKRNRRGRKRAAAIAAQDYTIWSDVITEKEHRYDSELVIASRDRRHDLVKHEAAIGSGHPDPLEEYRAQNRRKKHAKLQCSRITALATRQLNTIDARRDGLLVTHKKKALYKIDMLHALQREDMLNCTPVYDQQRCEITTQFNAQRRSEKAKANKYKRNE